MELFVFRRGLLAALMAAAVFILGPERLRAQDIDVDVPDAGDRDIPAPGDEPGGDAPVPGESVDEGDTEAEEPGEPSEEEPGAGDFTGVELPEEEIPTGPDVPAPETVPGSPAPDASAAPGVPSGGATSPAGTPPGQESPAFSGVSSATAGQAAPGLGEQGGGAPSAEVETAVGAPRSSDVQVMDEEDDDEHEFLGLTLAPEVGYIFFPESDLTVNGFKASVQARNGFIAKAHLDLGGDGFAFELAPLFAVEAGGIDTAGGDFGDMSINLNEGLGAGSFQAVGGQMSLVWRFGAGRFYPGFGLGFHGAYLMGDSIDYGLELYGRVPVGFTVYLAERLGLVVEAGFMFGVTGIRTPLDWSNLEAAGLSDQAVADAKQISTQQELEDWIARYESQFGELDPSAVEEYQGIDPETAAQDIVMNQLADSLRFGVGFGIDLMVGLRFP